MQCPGCRQDNPAGARFCAACGTRLAAACATCGAGLPAGARFCPACGGAVATATAAPARTPDVYTPRHLAERILTSRAALQGERKPVTVLFCDLVGSTGLAEGLGPDAMHDLLNRFFEARARRDPSLRGHRQPVPRRWVHGVVRGPARARGPRAPRGAGGARRGPRAEQAARARHRRPGDTQRSHGAQHRARRRRSIGDNLRMDYTAIGECTNVAARLQQAAAPGAILVSATTARLIEDYVPCELVGALDIRGRSSPITAFRLIGVRRRSPSSDGRSRKALQSLRRPRAGGGHAARAGRRGRARPGAHRRHRRRAGHRQVAAAPRGPARGRGGGVTWLEGRCLSYGGAIPYLPVLECSREPAASRRSIRPKRR